MSWLRQVELGASFPPFASLQDGLGFIPNLFRAQGLLPEAIEAEAQIAGVVLLKEVGLSRTTKESILLQVAAAHQNTYCVTAHYQILRSLGIPERQLDQMMIDHHGA